MDIENRPESDTMPVEFIQRIHCHAEPVEACRVASLRQA